MSHGRAQEDLRTWVEINRTAIARNYHGLRKLIAPETKFMAVVKSNAYGHNILEFASEMERLGADWIGVDSFIEGIAVRNRGVRRPVLVLGYTLPQMFPEAIRRGISITISNNDQLRALLAYDRSKQLAHRKLNIHIKVDTGMHRQGFQRDEMGAVISVMKKLAGSVRVQGLFTHLAEAKNPRSGDATRRQIAEFREWIRTMSEEGFRPIVHAAATGGAMLYPEAHFDMVRFGIGCYGLWPSPEAERFLSKKVKFFPVLSWRAIVSEVKRVRKGERVGYDFTEMLTRDSTLTIIPVGYWHGVPRLLSSRGRVLLRGKSARIVGRVSMDMIIVDTTDIPGVRVGDIATLIGRDGDEEIKAGEIAAFAGTTHYEIVTRLNPLMKKVYK